MGATASLLGSSVGRKAIMAGTGLMLCLFLLAHLVGNITLLIADDGTLTANPGATDAGEHFQGVVAAYGKIPALLYLMEAFLVLLFATHIAMGLTLWLQNRRARGPHGYAVHRWEGGRTLGSATMPITGVFVILVFLIVHLINFRLGPAENPAQMYSLVDLTLGHWAWALAYGLALVGLMIHLSHGVQSAFQSLGFRHARWTARLKALGWGYAMLVLAGFGVLPLLFVLKGVAA